MEEGEAETNSLAVVRLSTHFPYKEEAEEVLKVAHEPLLHYSVLSRIATDLQECLFIVEPKHHFFWHVAKNASYIHPRLAWTYADEDFIGRVAKVAASCVQGTGPLRLSKILMMNISG